MKSVIQKTPFLFVLIITIACNNGKQSTKTGTTNTDEMKVMIPAQTCYTGYLMKDTILLKVERFPNVVTGVLEYRFYEKDRSKGELDGKIYGDTLVANYTFSSEGKKSIRQVAFLLKNDLAIEGLGEMEDRNGKMIFKNLNEIKFDGILTLHKTNCN